MNLSRSGWYEMDKKMSNFRLSTMKYQICYVKDIFLNPFPNKEEHSDDSEYDTESEADDEK